MKLLACCSSHPSEEGVFQSSVLEEAPSLNASHAKAQRRKGLRISGNLCAFAPLRETSNPFTNGYVSQKHKQPGGFTLLEIAVVLIIASLLIGAGSVMVSGMMNDRAVQ